MNSTLSLSNQPSDDISPGKKTRQHSSIVSDHRRLTFELQVTRVALPDENPTIIDIDRSETFRLEYAVESNSPCRDWIDSPHVENRRRKTKKKSSSRLEGSTGRG